MALETLQVLYYLHRLVLDFLEYPESLSLPLPEFPVDPCSLYALERRIPWVPYPHAILARQQVLSPPAHLVLPWAPFLHPQWGRFGLLRRSQMLIRATPGDQHPLELQSAQKGLQILSLR